MPSYRSVLQEPILISLPVPGVITIWVICFPFCPSMLIVLPEPRNTPKPSDCQDPLVSIIRQPSSVMTPSGESGFSGLAAIVAKSNRAVFATCPALGSASVLTVVVVQRTRIRFGIGRIGNYRNIVLHCVFRHFKFNSRLNTPCFTSVPQVTSYEAAPSTGFQATVTVLPDAVAESPVGVGSAVKGAEEPHRTIIDIDITRRGGQVEITRTATTTECTRSLVCRINTRNPSIT